MKLFNFIAERKRPRRAFNRAAAVFGLSVLCLAAGAAAAHAQQAEDKDAPVIVQPGAPGQPSKILPASTKGTLPPHSTKDTEFMQGMIHHHAQAVEMTALIDANTENKEVRLLGARISQSQSDEMNFMRRWLAVRGEPSEMTMAGNHQSGNHTSGNHSTGDHASGNHSSTNHAAEHRMLMPGMLTPKQMDALKKAKGAEFDRLFLAGMIQHHKGALVMVKELFDTTDGGQNAELFIFATDVDSGQRAEIKIMENMLGVNP